MATEARLRANARYQQKAYDKIFIRTRKDAEITKDRIDEAARAVGESTQAYILGAIKDRMEKGY